MHFSPQDIPQFTKEYIHSLPKERMMELLDMVVSDLLYCHERLEQESSTDLQNLQGHVQTDTNLEYPEPHSDL